MSKTRGVFSQRITNLTLSALLVATSIFTAVPFLLSSAVSAAPSAVFSQGFETDTAGYFQGGSYGSITQVASGTAGVLSASGSSHAVIEGAASAPYTNFDQRRDVWTGSWNTSTDVYLDTSWANGQGFDYSVASNGTDGNHQRDFIAHVEKDASTGQLLFAGSNNTNFVPKTNLEVGNHYVVPTSGWYTIQHVFRDNAGVLAVDINLLNQSGVVLFTETRSNVADTIPAEIGGNRYGWFNYTNITDGFAIDNVQLTVETPDTERPSASFVNPSVADQAFSGDADISFSATDNGQLASMVVNIKDANNTGNLGSCGSVSGLSSPSYTLNCTIDTTAFADGTYYLRAGAVDAAGNNRTISRSVVFDNTNPSVAITSPVSNAVVGGSFVIEGTVSDATSGVAGVQIVVNKWVDGVFQGRAVDFENATVTGSTFQFNVNDLETLQNGYYALRAIATDNAGNTKTAGHNVIVDGVRPVTTLVNPIVDQVNPTQIVVEATDNIGLSRVTANLYDETNTTLISSCSEILTGGQTAYTLTCELGDSLADGTYTIRANAQDATGKTSNTVIRTFSIDTTPPQVTITGPATAAQGDDVTFNGEILGEFNDITITIDGVDYAPTIVDIVNGTWSFDFNTASLTPGPFTVSVSADDAAGNVSEVNEFTAIAFTVAEPQVLGENTDDDTQTSVDAPGTDNTSAPLARNTPTIVGPANDAQVLGETSGDESTQTGTTDVEGVDTVAQALTPDSDENQGTFAGLAWYWWLLIIAGVAALIGLITRGIRNRAE